VHTLSLHPRLPPQSCARERMIIDERCAFISKIFIDASCMMPWGLFSVIVFVRSLLSILTPPPVTAPHTVCWYLLVHIEGVHSSNTTPRGLHQALSALALTSRESGGDSAPSIEADGGTSSSILINAETSSPLPPYPLLPAPGTSFDTDTCPMEYRYPPESVSIGAPVGEFLGPPILSMISDPGVT
jgi:hypothetical protein